MTARTRTVYDDITEKQWQAQIDGLLKLQGYKAYHVYDSRRTEPGFPDVIALNPKTGDILVAELKTERGVLTPKQIAWLEWFDMCGITAHVWRPSDIDKVIAHVATKVRITP